VQFYTNKFAFISCIYYYCHVIDYLIVKYYTFMTRFEQKKLDLEFSRFTKMNFDKPQKCRSIGQIRYYMNELSTKISELKQHFNYVPSSAHILMSQYNAAQNRLIHKNFQEVYC